MFNTGLHKALILIVFVALLIILYHQNNSFNNGSINTCEVYAQKCIITLDQGEMIVDFPQQLVVEEMLDVNITLPDGLQIDQVVIEGVNMYMGKLPVHFEPTSEKTKPALVQPLHVGEFYLGSCHLNTMQWQMIINLRTDGPTTIISPQENERQQKSILLPPVSVLFTTNNSL